MTDALRTARLEITPLSRDDIAAFVEYRRDAAVARYQSWDPGYSESDAEALVTAQPASGVPEAGDWVQLGLRRARDGAVGAVLVGDIGVGAVAGQPDTYELGVTVAPTHQSNGFATEGLTRVVDWLMREQRAHRIVMQCDARNAPIRSVIRRVGLRPEGAFVDGDWFKGEWTTLEHFALLRSEWLARGN